MATMATSVRNPRRGVLRFFGRGGRVVLRAEPQGDGWWWIEGTDGAGIAAVGRPRGRLYDLDLVERASLDAEELRMGGVVWPVDGSRCLVGPRRDPVLRVELDDGVLVVRHPDGFDRRVAALAALVLPRPSPYTTPTPSPAIGGEIPMVTPQTVGLIDLAIRILGG